MRRVFGVALAATLVSGSPREIETLEEAQRSVHNSIAELDQKKKRAGEICNNTYKNECAAVRDKMVRGFTATFDTKIKTFNTERGTLTMPLARSLTTLDTSVLTELSRLMNVDQSTLLPDRLSQFARLEKTVPKASPHVKQYFLNALELVRNLDEVFKWKQIDETLLNDFSSIGIDILLADQRTDYIATLVEERKQWERMSDILNATTKPAERIEQLLAIDRLSLSYFKPDLLHQAFLKVAYLALESNEADYEPLRVVNPGIIENMLKLEPLPKKNSNVNFNNLVDVLDKIRAWTQIKFNDMQSHTASNLAQQQRNSEKQKLQEQVHQIKQKSVEGEYKNVAVEIAALEKINNGVCRDPEVDELRGYVAPDYSATTQRIRGNYRLAVDTKTKIDDDFKNIRKTSSGHSHFAAAYEALFAEIGAKMKALNEFKENRIKFPTPIPGSKLTDLDTFNFSENSNKLRKEIQKLATIINELLRDKNTFLVSFADENDIQAALACDDAVSRVDLLNYLSSWSYKTLLSAAQDSSDLFDLDEKTGLSLRFYTFEIRQRWYSWLLRQIELRVEETSKLLKNSLPGIPDELSEVNFGIFELASEYQRRQEGGALTFANDEDREQHLRDAKSALEEKQREKKSILSPLLQAQADIDEAEKENAELLNVLSLVNALIAIVKPTQFDLGVQVNAAHKLAQSMAELVLNNYQKLLNILIDEAESWFNLYYKLNAGENSTNLEQTIEKLFSLHQRLARTFLEEPISTLLDMFPLDKIMDEGSFDRHLQTLHTELNDKKTSIHLAPSDAAVESAKGSMIAFVDDLLKGNVEKDISSIESELAQLSNTVKSSATDLMKIFGDIQAIVRANYGLIRLVKYKDQKSQLLAFFGKLKLTFIKLDEILTTLEQASLAENPSEFSRVIQTLLQDPIVAQPVDDNIKDLTTDLRDIQIELESARQEVLKLQFSNNSVKLTYTSDRDIFFSEIAGAKQHCKEIYDRDLKPKAQFNRLTTLSQGRLADMLKPLTELCETSVLIWEVASMSGKSNIEEVAAVNLLKKLEEPKDFVSNRRKDVLKNARDKVRKLITMDDEAIYQKIVYANALQAYKDEKAFTTMTIIKNRKSELEASAKKLAEFIETKEKKKESQKLNDFELQRLVESKRLITKITRLIAAITQKVAIINEIEKFVEEATVAKTEAEKQTISKSAEEMKEIAKSSEDEDVKASLRDAMSALDKLKADVNNPSTLIKEVEDKARSVFTQSQHNGKNVNPGVKALEKISHDTKGLLSQKTAEWNEAISKANIAVESLKSTLVAKKLIDNKQGGDSKVKGGEEESEGKDGGSDDKKNNSGASSSTVKKGKGMGAGLIAVIVASAVLVLGGAAAFLYFNQKPRTA